MIKSPDANKLQISDRQCEVMLLLAGDLRILQSERGKGRAYLYNPKCKQGFRMTQISGTTVEALLDRGLLTHVMRGDPLIRWRLNSTGRRIAAEIKELNNATQD